MSKGSHSAGPVSRSNRRANFAGDQADLFQQLAAAPAPAADLDLHYELLGAINKALRQARQHGLTRERVADRMNDLLPDLERAITVRQLYAWTATSKEYSEFPARYLPAFCAAVDCDLPLRVLAQALGADLVDARELAAKRLGETQIEAARLRREARSILERLGG